MKMNKIHLRIMSLLLCLVMILGMAPAIQLFTAAEAAPTTGESCGHDQTHLGWNTLGEAGTNTTVTATTLAGGGNFVLEGDITIPAVVNLTADLHICLNGHTIYGTTASGNMFTVKNSTMTVCDCVGGGKIDATGTGENNTIVSIGDNGIFKLYGGKLTGKTTSAGGAAVRVEKGTSKFYMYGGEISGNQCTVTGATAAHSIFINNGASFIMSGGKISGNTPTGNTKPSVLVYNGNVELTGNAVIEDTISLITGSGTVKDLVEGARIISSSKLTIPSSDQTAMESVANNIYTYTYRSPIAQVGSTTYYSLKDAIAAVTVMGTVKVLQDTTLDNITNINNGVDLTIDLNGKTVSATGAQNVFTLIGTESAAVSLTIKDSVGGGKIDASGKTGGNTIVAVRDYATFNLEGGKLTGKTGSAGGPAVRLEKATSEFNMSGGSITGNTYTGTNSAVGAKSVYITAGAVFNMSGGSITDNAAPNSTAIGSILIRDGGSVVFSGTAKFDDDGFVQTGTPAAVIQIRELADGARIVTTTQITDVDDSIKEVVGDGTYTYTYKLAVPDVAMVGETYYKNLEDAFANADGQTVQLLEDVTLEEPIDISGKVILDLNSRTITAKKGAFTVSGTNELTINDNTDEKAGQIKADAEAEKVPAIHIGATGEGGKLNLNNGKISGFSCTKGAGVCVDGTDSQFNMTGGEISGNTATEFGGGVYVHGGVFNMSGGKITDNKVGSAKQDIYVETELAVSGTSVISMVALADGATGKILELEEDADITAASELDITAAVNCQPVDNSGSWRYMYSDAAIAGTEILPGTELTELTKGKYFLGGDITLSSGLTITESVKLDLNGYTITGVTAPFFTIKDGGKLTIIDLPGNGKLDGSTLTNSAAAGLISVGNKGTFILEGGTITGHTTTGFGGGVRVDSDNAVFTMKGGAISGNTSKGGGGIYISKGTFVMEGGEITGNTASAVVDNVPTSKDAGGIYLGAGTVTLKGGEISNNTGNNGGAFYIAGGTLNIAGGKITGNIANGNGSVVYSNESTINITGGLISGNKSAGNDTINVSKSTFTMESGTIKGNTKLDGETPTNVYFGNYLAATSAIISGDAVIEDVIGLAGIRNEGKENEIPAPVVKVGELTEGARIRTKANLVVEGSNVATKLVSVGLEYVYGIGSTDGGIIIDVPTIAELPAGNYTLNGDVYLDKTITIKGEVVLDLNGHTITGVQAPYFKVENGTLTLNDSGENGKLDGSVLVDSGASGLVSVTTNGTFNLNGGIITGHKTTTTAGGVRVDGINAVFNMNGGEISGNACVREGEKPVYSFGGGVFVYRGVFNMYDGLITGNTGIGAGVCITSDKPANDNPEKIGVFNMYGGTIEGNTCTTGGEVHIRPTYTGIINISGSAVIGGVGIQCDATIGNLAYGASVRSLMKLSITDYYLRETTIRVGDVSYLLYTYSGTEMPDVAQVGSTGYKTLEEAIKAANGKTVKLLADVNIGKGVKIPAGTSMTLDLNGKTVTGSAAPYFTVENSTLTIFDSKSGGKVDGSSLQNSTAHGLISVGNNATLNLKSGTVCGHTTTGSGAGVRVDGVKAVFNMSGGAITDNHTRNYGGGVFVPRGTFNMSGGSITGNSGVGGGVNVASDKKTEEEPTEIGVFNMSGGTVKDNNCRDSGEVHIRLYYSGVINISGNAVIAGVGMRSSYAVLGKLTDGASILSNTRLKVTDERTLCKTVTLDTGKEGYLYEYDPTEYQKWEIFEEDFESFTTGTDVFYNAVISSNDKNAYPYWSDIVTSYHGTQADGKYSQYSIGGTAKSKYLELKSVNGMQNMLRSKTTFSGPYSVQMDFRFVSGQTARPVLGVTLFHGSSLGGNVQAYIVPGEDQGARVQDSLLGKSSQVKNDDGTKFTMDYDVWYTMECSYKEGEISLSIWETGKVASKLTATLSTPSINPEVMAESSIIRINNVGKAGRTDVIRIDNLLISKKVVLTMQDAVTAVPGEMMTTVPAGDINTQLPVPAYKYELANKELGYTNRSGVLTAGYRDVADTTLSSGTTKLTMTLMDIRGNKTGISYTVDMIVANANGMSIGSDIKVKEGSVGASKQLSATVKADVAAKVPNYKLRWTSSDETVVKVDGNGKLTYTGLGTALIVAKLLNADGTETRYFASTKVQVGPTFLRVLSLGSSLGRDSVMYLSQLAYAADFRIETAALCNGLDSVRDNAFNLSYDEPYYNLYTADPKNGEMLLAKKEATITEVVESQNWDVIIINPDIIAQGIRGAFGADLEYVIDYLEDVQPKAKLYWNVIWSIQSRFISVSDGPGFKFKYYYNTNPNIQYNCTYDMVEQYLIGDGLFSSSNPNNLGATDEISGINWGIDGYIANATTIQELRLTTGHDRGLTRNGMSLSFDIGRLAASMTVLKTLYDDFHVGGWGVKLDLSSKITAAEVDKFVNTTKKDYNYGKNSTAADNVVAEDESKYVYASSDLKKVIDAVNTSTTMDGIPADQTVPETQRAEEMNEEQVVTSIQVEPPLKLHFPDIKTLKSGVMVASAYEAHHHSPTTYSSAANNPYEAAEEGAAQVVIFESTDNGYTWNYENPILRIDDFLLEQWGVGQVYDRYSRIGAAEDENYIICMDPRDPNLGTADIDFNGDGVKDDVLLVTFWTYYFDSYGKVTNALWLLTGMRNANGTYSWNTPLMIETAHAKRGDITSFSDGEILMPAYSPDRYAIRLKWDVRAHQWVQKATHVIPNLIPEEFTTFNEISLVAPDPDSDVVYCYCRTNGQVAKSYDRGATWELVGNEDGTIGQPGFTILDEERVFVTWSGTASPRQTFGKVFYVNSDWSDTRKEVIYASANTAAHDVGDPSCAVNANGDVVVIGYDVHYRSVVISMVDPTEDKWLPLELSMRNDTIIYQSDEDVTLSDTDAIPADVKVYGSHTITATVEFTKADGVVTIQTVSGTFEIPAGEFELNKPTNILFKAMGRHSFVKIWQGDEKPEKWSIYLLKNETAEKPIITGDGAILKDVIVSAKFFASLEESASTILGVSRLELNYSVQPATAELIFTSSNPEVATVDEKTGVVTPLKVGTTTITMSVSGLLESTCEVTVTPPPTELTEKELGDLVLWEDFEEEKYTAGKDALWEAHKSGNNNGSFTPFKDGVGKDDEMSGDVLYNIVKDATGNQYLEITNGNGWILSKEPIYGNYTAQFDVLFTVDKQLAFTLWQNDLRVDGSNEIHSFVNLTEKGVRFQYRPMRLLSEASNIENPNRISVGVNQAVDDTMYQKTTGKRNIWQSVKVMRVEGGTFIKVWNRDTETEPEEWSCALTHSILDTDLQTHFRIQWPGGAGDTSLYLDNVKVTQHTHTVTYDVDGVKTTALTPADKDLLPPEEEPTKKDYKFVAWYEGDKEWVFLDNPVTRDLNLTAKWIEHKTVEIPVSSGDNSIKLEVVLEGDTVTIVSFSSKQMAQLIGGDRGVNDVVIDLTGVEIDAKNVVMPVKIMEQILSIAKKAEVDTESLVIKLRTGTVRFNHKAMQAVSEQVEGTNLTLTLKNTELDNLNDAQKAAIKSKDVRGGISVTLKSTKTDEQITDFMDGKVTLQVPFTPADGDNSAYFSMWHVSEEGELTKQNTKCEDGYLTWSVGHFSDYLIIYEVNLLWVIIIVCVLALAGAAAAVIIIRKKKKKV